MEITVASAPEGARAGQAGDTRSIEEMLERLPAELLLAEKMLGDHSAADDVEQQFWTDPCHFLRRACQVADYESCGATNRAAETPGLPR
jgi:hypothetical protein